MAELEPVVEQVVDWRTESTRVDLVGRMVTDVVLSGDVSKNGHRYGTDTLRAAAVLYAGKPVFLDHAARGTRPYERSARDLVGTVQEARYEEGRLRGDIRVLDTEAGRTFLAILESDSPAVGMSHVVLAERAAAGGQVERIHDVVSVDAVVFPATTRGFREQFDDDGESATVEELRREISDLRAERQVLEAQCARLQADERDRQADLEVTRLLTAAGLPAELVTEGFRRQLAAADEGKRRELIAERAELGRRLAARVPASLGRGREGVTDDRWIARVLRGRAVN